MLEFQALNFIDNGLGCYLSTIDKIAKITHADSSQFDVMDTLSIPD